MMKKADPEGRPRSYPEGHVHNRTEGLLLVFKG